MFKGDRYNLPFPGRAGGVSPPDEFEGLLDTYQAAIGVGLRRLSTDHTQSVTLRRADLATETFGWTGTGHLPIAAIESWLDGQQGFVARVYGAGTLDDDLFQTTHDDQPTISDVNGVVHRHPDTGKPYIQFNGRFFHCEAVSALRSTDWAFAYSVIRFITDGPWNAIIWQATQGASTTGRMNVQTGNSISDRFRLYPLTSRLDGQSASAGTSVYYRYQTAYTMLLHSFANWAGGIRGWRRWTEYDGGLDSQGTASMGTSGFTSDTDSLHFTVGADNAGNRSGNYTLSEFILFNDDTHEAVRQTVIPDNIRGYWQ